MPNTPPPFQDQQPGNHCWGCGPNVPQGLKIKSYWSGDLTVCTWEPRPEFAAGPRHILYGGTIGILFDCHGIWTAIATAYRNEDRAIGAGELIWYVTGTLKVSYRRPTPIDRPLTLTARVTDATDRKTVVTASLESDGEERATAELVAIRVTPDWFSG
jgi:acyl-coenzyme A thioesterase PaaI-like protein